MTRINQLILCLFLFTGCTDQPYEQAKNQRAQIASAAKEGDPIIIGVSWRDANKDLFIQGVKLAVKEINQKGGVFHSPLQIVFSDSESPFYDESLSLEQRQDLIFKIANSFAANPHLIAVIGHSSSSIAILASVIYQNYGILFIAPNSTNAKLTGHNFDYIFRAIPTNSEISSQLADFAAQQGYKNIALVHGRGEYETELANTFSTYAIEKYATNIVYRRSFFNKTVNIISLITDLKNIQKLDAVFIASNSQITAKIYRLARDMGLKLPILVSEAVDTKVFIDQLKQWENIKGIQKSGIPTLFNESMPNSRKFIERFKQEYGQDVQPDYFAALGYDTVNLLAHGLQLAQSTVPIEIAVALRYMEACKGVTGKFEYKTNGDLKYKPMFFKRYDQGHFIYEQVKSSAETTETNMDICNEIDLDNDTIPNNMDACPNTTAEENVHGIIINGSNRGCPLDDDDDGVPNYKDSCLNNSFEEIEQGVDARGCPLGNSKKK